MVAVNLKVLEQRRQLPYEELPLEGVMVGVGVVLLSPPPWPAPQKHGIITTATISAEEGMPTWEGTTYFSQNKHNMTISCETGKKSQNQEGELQWLRSSLLRVSTGTHGTTAVAYKLMPGAPPSRTFQSHSLSSNPNLNWGQGPEVGI